MIPPPARKSNRTLWLVVGIVGAIGICCCGGVSGLGYFGFRQGSESDREAKVFATKAVKEIGKTWSKEAFAEYGAPVFQKSLKTEKTAIYVTAFRKKLGPLKSLGEFTTRGIYFGTKNGLPPATRVTMDAPATFEKGKGKIVIGVAKANDAWGIENFNIQSDDLVK